MEAANFSFSLLKGWLNWRFEEMFEWKAGIRNSRTFDAYKIFEIDEGEECWNCRLIVEHKSLWWLNDSDYCFIEFLITWCQYNGYLNLHFSVRMLTHFDALIYSQSNPQKIWLLVLFVQMNWPRNRKKSPVSVSYRLLHLMW